MKKLILLLMALCLVGCTTTKEEDKKNTACGDEGSTSCSLEESADMSDYENFINKDNQFIKSDMPSVLSILEKKQNAVVYFGFPKCPWCVEALPILNDVAKQQGIEILYVQTRDNDKKSLISDEEKKTIMEYTDKFLDKNEEGNKQFYVPFVITIEDGKVTAGHVGTVDGYDTSERKMNEQEKQELTNIYTEMLKDKK